MNQKMYRFVICLAVCVLVPYTFVEAQQSNAVARCFQFTWLGPRYNNESEFLNATCQDATRLASGVPCFQPLVVSYDGTWPDVEYIWRNHPMDASCILANNDVCATYTYYFDNKVENSTYMCSRAVNADGQAITSGCYTQRNGSFATRACFCRSIPGGVPCNNAVSMAASMTAVLSVLIMLNKELAHVWRSLISLV